MKKIVRHEIYDDSGEISSIVAEWLIHEDRIVIRAIRVESNRKMSDSQLKSAWVKGVHWANHYEHDYIQEKW